MGRPSFWMETTINTVDIFLFCKVFFVKVSLTSFRLFAEVVYVSSKPKIEEESEFVPKTMIEEDIQEREVVPKLEHETASMTECDIDPEPQILIEPNNQTFQYESIMKVLINWSQKF